MRIDKKDGEQPLTLRFESRTGFARWLKANHTQREGIWLEFAKKGSGISSISHAEALELALCYGWIDGQVAKCEEPYWRLRFTPRRPRSKWSKKNCAAAETLIATGKMQPAGLREVEAARADGRWERAYDSPRNMAVPADLQQRLEEEPEARTFFATLSGANRYAILYRIHDAKKPETRARRIEQFLAMLRERKTVYPMGRK